MAHIHIATPMYGGQCTGVFVQSLLQTVELFTKNKHVVSTAFMFNESLITRARNNLTHQFLYQTKADVLFWIDADIKWRAEDAYRMFCADLDLIGGIYPKKEINWASVREAVLAGHEDLQSYTGSFVVNTLNMVNEQTVPEHLPAEVSAVGTGFMMVKRSALEQMREWTPTYRSDMSMLAGQEIHAYFQDPICPHTNRFLSEDYFFCDQWRRHGGKVYAAPWCRLGHMGTYLFEGGLWRDDGRRNKETSGDPVVDQSDGESPVPGEQP